METSPSYLKQSSEDLWKEKNTVLHGRQERNEPQKESRVRD